MTQRQMSLLPRTAGKRFESEMTCLGLFFSRAIFRENRQLLA